METTQEQVSCVFEEIRLVLFPSVSKAFGTQPSSPSWLLVPMRG